MMQKVGRDLVLLKNPVDFLSLGIISNNHFASVSSKQLPGLYSVLSQDSEDAGQVIHLVWLLGCSCKSRIQKPNKSKDRKLAGGPLPKFSQTLFFCHGLLAYNSPTLRTQTIIVSLNNPLVQFRLCIAITTMPVSVKVICIGVHVYWKVMFSRFSEQPSNTKVTSEQCICSTFFVVFVYMNNSPSHLDLYLKIKEPSPRHERQVNCLQYHSFLTSPLFLMQIFLVIPC